MSDDDRHRVRFYGIDDLGSGLQGKRVFELVDAFDPERVPTSIVDIIELHNVQQYLKNGFVPRDYTPEERAEVQALIPQIRGVVARFFSTIDEASIADVVVGVGFEYHSALLELLGRSRAYDRCAAATVLPVLTATGVRLGSMLGCRKLVNAYDAEVRNAILGDPRNAEFVVRKHLQNDVRDEIHLPRSFTADDSRDLLTSYIDSEGAHPNYVGLVVTARVNADIGVDDRLKLRAKRRKREMTEKFFEGNTGFKTGCAVGISRSQSEPVKVENEEDGMVSRYIYSGDWLEGTCDYPSILSNFQHLFEFADEHGVLRLPSYKSNMGIVDRFMTTTGRTEYHVGFAFHSVDTRTHLQTTVYQQFLETKEIDLESVVAWFFEEYLVDEFGTSNFSFTPSDSGSSYLQRIRHLFPEMEGVVSQFNLFVEDGEIDRELLTIGSNSVNYQNISSQLEGKYVYPGDGDEIARILFALFSDQSMLNYIREDLQADSAALLLVTREVAYGDYADYHKPTLDYLIEVGILEDTGTRLQFASTEQLYVLAALHRTEVESYYHLSEEGRAQADAMVERGWLVRRSSLLSDAESNYFNYFLNNTTYSNGPALRNKYAHGSQANEEGEDAHLNTYITVLRLLVALVIKLNDDFCLAADESAVAR